MFHFLRIRRSTSRISCSTSWNRYSTSSGFRVPLPPESAFHFVWITHSTSLDYKKTLIDPVSVEGGFATTWHRGSAGTHGGDAAYIVSNVSEHLDQFLTEYLRVNEAACSAR